MLTEEYKEMYRRVYGCEAEDNNSYLYAEECPDDVDYREYNKYRDYSNCVQYMDYEDLQDSPFDYDDSSDVSDLDYQELTGFSFDEIPLRTPANFTAHAYPLRSNEIAAIKEIPSSDTVTINNGVSMKEETLARLTQCPCFLLSMACSPMPKSDKHDCRKCTWCSQVPPVNSHHVLVGHGATYSLSPHHKYIGTTPGDWHVDEATGFSRVVFPRLSPFAYTGSLGNGRVTLFHNGYPIAPSSHLKPGDDRAPPKPLLVSLDRRPRNDKNPRLSFQKLPLTASPLKPHKVNCGDLEPLGRWYAPNRVLRPLKPDGRRLAN